VRGGGRETRITHVLIPYFLIFQGLAMKERAPAELPKLLQVT
jgi:hypothetical protein